MVNVRSVALCTLLLLLAGPAMAGGAGEATRVYQDFGYVEVGAGDVQTAIAEGRAARAAARDVLGIPDARFAIVEAGVEAGPAGATWGTRSPDGAPVYPWVFARRADDARIVPPNYVLRHEIGHDLFVRYLVPRTRTAQYGGDAPDWLDEMAAVAFEGCVQAAGRRAEAARFARTGTLIPLHRFLTMAHPELAAKRPSGSPGQIFSVALATSNDTPQFYAMARAFYDFLVDRTGSAGVIADLAAAFRGGQSLEKWVRVHAGSGHHDGGLTTVNAAFLAWLATDSRYRPGVESGDVDPARKTDCR